MAERADSSRADHAETRAEVDQFDDILPGISNRGGGVQANYLLKTGGEL